MTYRLQGLLRVIIDHTDPARTPNTVVDAVFKTIDDLGFGEEEVDYEVGHIQKKSSELPYNFIDIPVCATIGVGTSEESLLDGILTVPGVKGVLFFAQEDIYHSPTVSIPDTVPVVLSKLYFDNFVYNYSTIPYKELGKLVIEGTALDLDTDLTEHLKPLITEHLVAKGIVYPSSKLHINRIDANPDYGRQQETTHSDHCKGRYHYRGYYSLRTDARAEGLTISSHIWFSLNEHPERSPEEKYVTDFWHP